MKAKTSAEVVNSRRGAGILEKTLAAEYKVITLFYVLCELLGISNDYCKIDLVIKPEYPERKLLEQSREPANSAHLGR